MSESAPRMHFIAVTKYHLFVAHLLKASYFRNCESHLMISQQMDDAEGIFRRIKSSGEWNDVTFLNYYDLYALSRNDYFDKLKRIRFVKKSIRALVKEKGIERLCLFTFGNPFSNIMSNDESISDLWLAEDGCFPYYGLAFARGESDSTYISIKNLKGFSQRVKSRIYKARGNIFCKYLNFDNGHRINKILLIKPEYFRDEAMPDARLFKVEYDESVLSRSFERVSASLGYKASEIYKDIDIVYFDSDYAGLMSDEEEAAAIENILSCFPHKRILLKLRTQKGSKKEILFKRLAEKHSRMVVDEVNAHIPWEVIYFNNIDRFKDITLLSSGSTAAFSSKIIFDRETNNIDLSHIFWGRIVYDDRTRPIIKAFEQFKQRVAESCAPRRYLFPRDIDELRMMAEQGPPREG